MSNSYNEYFKSAKKMNNKGARKMKKRPETKYTPKDDGSLISTKKITQQTPQRSRKKNTSSSLVPFLLFATGILLTGWGYLNVDNVMNFVDRIDINPMTVSEAVEKSKEKKSTDKSLSVENIASVASQSEDKKGVDIDYKKDENINHFTKLNDRKTELDLREKELNELESELHEQRKEIEARIKKLEDIRSQIGQVLKDKVEVDEERVKKLVEFYSNMKPQNAAQIISTLNEDLAVEILGRMKKKNAADILNLLKPEKAQVLTEKFAGYKRR